MTQPPPAPREEEAEITRLRELVAGAHAIKCTCGDHMRSTDGVWDMRDPRCIEFQALAILDAHSDIENLFRRVRALEGLLGHLVSCGLQHPHCRECHDLLRAFRAASETNTEQSSR